MAVMVLLSASVWRKLLEATTIYSPTCQSTLSVTVRVEVKGAMVAAMLVQVLTLGLPYMENLQLRQPMPLLPNMGC